MIKHKFKLKSLKRNGRQRSGKITVYNRGGGERFNLYNIDRGDMFYGVPFKVKKIYKNVRGVNGFLGEVYYTNGIKSLQIISDGISEGDILVRFDGLVYSDLVLNEGSVFTVGDLMIGDKIFNIELYPGSGFKLLRSGGVFGTIVRKFGILGGSIVKFKNGLYKFIFFNSSCVKGECSNKYNKDRELVKAGDSRKIGRRPSVRGVAMNPVDHPHGGGEGKSSGGRCSVTPWGKLTKGIKTRSIESLHRLKRAKNLMK